MARALRPAESGGLDVVDEVLWAIAGQRQSIASAGRLAAAGDDVVEHGNG
jgi:hypothetical protein